MNQIREHTKKKTTPETEKSKLNDFYLCHVYEVEVFLPPNKFPLLFFENRCSRVLSECAKCVACVFFSIIFFRRFISVALHHLGVSGFFHVCYCSTFPFVTCDNKRNSNKRTRHNARHTHTQYHDESRIYSFICVMSARFCLFPHVHFTKTIFIIGTLHFHKLFSVNSVHKFNVYVALFSPVFVSYRGFRFGIKCSKL